MTNLIKVTYGESEISATEAAQEQSIALRSRMADFLTVQNPQQQSAAVAAATDGRKFVKEIEAQRKTALEPLRDVTAKVNALAKSLSDPVEQEMVRVGRLVSNFQIAEAERVRKEEEARQAEIARRAEEERKAAIEAEKAAAAITTEADLKKAIEAESAQKAATDAWKSAVTAPPPAPVKATGSAIKKQMCYEVTDITALYAARPELCRLEPNAAAIRATVTVGMTIPGMKIWEEVVTSFRSR